ncbi:MAG: fumarylacetoacetate hydrolase family protein [Synergistaceae bacterium]|jgi:2-keto-4-pentenoate hydratase|nr:fumarylacetoacetate hydrolase family protein [Synergistaceae bacterium]
MAAHPRTAEFAGLLYNAGASRVAIDALTDIDPTFAVDDAYAVQMINVNRAVGQGRSISGKKIGLTSKGMQTQLGVDEPDYGHLFSDMLHTDGRIPTDEFLQPKIEAEIAYILKEDLSGGSVSASDVIAATDYVVGAFEIVDSRVRDWRIKLPDTIADNASSGCYVLGERRFHPRDIDLPSITMKLYKNGEPAGEGTGAAVLGDPSVSVAWLSNKLWNYGVVLKKGEIVLSGALSSAPSASRGDVFEARFSEFGVIRAEFV